MADFKTLAIGATVAGSVLLTGLTFTGTINLTDIKTKGFDWADKVSQAVTETQEMASTFDLFKTDVQAQINAKIAKINDLNAQIATLVEQVGNGEGNLEAANNEIARLNTELEKANAEIEALKAEFDLKDSEVQAVYADMETAESLDTTLVLDVQQPDTVIPESTTPEPVDYTAQETAIKTSINSTFPSITNVTVDVTDTTVTLYGEPLQNTASVNFESIIETELGKSVTYSSTPSLNTYVFTIN
jgi:outer membrane murein-binding lipoprotein Lpp